MAIRQRTPDLAQSEGLRTVKTRAPTRVAVPVLHDEASVSVDPRRRGDDRTLLEFIFFKEHDSREFGGVPMPLTGAIPEGRSFFCPHCGALYAVTYSRLSTSDSNIARCVVCGQIMDKWDSTKVPIFKLIHRPEDH